MNKTNISTPLNVNTQLPLDYKTYVYDVNSLLDLGLNQTKAFSYYVGMKVYCALQKEIYIWREYEIINEPNGLISNGYTYPLGIINDYDYSNKKFNFFKVTESNVSPVINNFINNEVPTGLMNGSNATFTSQFNFVPSTLSVFLNGILQRIIFDYNTSLNNTINLIASPESTENILINYIKL